MSLEMIADYACEVGEGPQWHPTEQRLYWADIPGGRLFRYDPSTGEHEQFYDGDVVGGFTFQEDGALLLFMEMSAVAVWRDGNLSYIIDRLPGEEENRFNDVFVDAGGRVFCGTMPKDSKRGPERLGSLYRLDTDGAITKVLTDVAISNGMGHTPDRTGLYYTDTLNMTIDLFDYDVETGGISNRRVFADTSDEEGMPDGMTVDAEGYVWSARWDGSALIRYAPSGEVDRRVHFPVKKVTSVAFGGEGYSDIYATTGGGNDKAAEGEQAGALFRVTPGVSGVPEFFSRVRI